MTQANLNQYPAEKSDFTPIPRNGVKQCPKCGKWAFKPLNIGRSRWKCGKCGHILFSRTYKRKLKEKIAVGVVDAELAEESKRQKERSLEIQKMRMER